MLWLASAFAAGNPIVSVERGVFLEPLTVEVSASAVDESVLCSFDGSPPASACPPAHEISATTILRVQQVAGDGSVSPIVTHTYLFPEAVAATAVMDTSVTQHPIYGIDVVESLSALPSISLVVASAGLSTAEQPASAEWINPSGDDMQVNCGVALSGTTSLAFPKNSIRLYFREEYGEATVEFDFWGEDAPGVRPSLDQDALSLRSGHDSVFYLGAQGQYTRNFWMDETQLEMGHLAPHGRFAHLDLNGEYRGLYHVRERFNAAFMANYMGGDKEDYEAINGGVTASGSGAAWGSALAAQGDWGQTEPWVDLPAFLDYMVLSFYAGNAWDWSYNHNWYAAGPSAPNEGGFRFESSDCDICLYYDYTVDITGNPGPSYLFYYLETADSPDFRVAWADAIHRNLEAGGPLTAERAGNRYAGIAAQIEDAVVAESARWGGGWWTRDAHWIPERDRLLDGYFPYRTDEMLRQFRNAGWYPLGAPTFSVAAGTIESGTSISVSLPDGGQGQLWITVDGSDPRVSGGAIAERAFGDEGAIILDHSTVLRARMLDGETWGPLAEAFYEVDESSPIVLNEWNAVETGETLDARDFDGSGSDDALGVVAGNGGDWIELLVTEDVDIRGWTLSMRDTRGERGTLVFGDQAPLDALRAGTLLTIAEDLPQDATYNPESGDWRLHLRAGADGDGTYVSATPFDTSSHDFQVTLRDAEGVLRFGPAGEGISPRSGIGDHEVGILAETPLASLRRTTGAWGASTRSTFGAPNQWEGGQQSLAALRGESGGVLDLPDPPEATVPSDDLASPSAKGCGCSTATGHTHWAALAVLALYRRRK